MTLYATSAALMLTAWLTPLHFLPWISWHSEAWAFAAMVIGFANVCFEKFRGSRNAIAIPLAAWPFLGLSAVVVAQFFAGQINYFGDAIVLLFYMAVCIGSLAVGFNLACRDSESHLPLRQQRNILEWSACLLLVGALSSAGIALIQVLNVWSDAEWILRMPALRRPGGNLAQPNQLATLILFGIVSLVYLFERRYVTALVAVPAAVVLVIGVATTESRTGAMSLLLVSLWWVAKYRALDFKLRPPVLGAWIALSLLLLWFWPTLFNTVQISGMTAIGDATVSTATGTRPVVWLQLWDAALQRPWLGWGLREVSTAHNSVLGTQGLAEPFTYAHNVVLDLAVGMGLPLTFLLVIAGCAWFYRRVTMVQDLTSWYCIALILPFAVHSLLEFPFAYAYLLAPIMFSVGILESRVAPFAVLRAPLRLTAAVSAAIVFVAVWSVFEYISIEEDFRVARFEALHVGQTPADYERPRIHLLTQLDALLNVARVVPIPSMPIETIEEVRQVAMRFPWTATQNRYALSLALNGNAEEALRQLNIIRAMHGAAAYARIKVQWETLAQEKYPQLRNLKMP
jgi:O-antigen ligase